LRRGVCRRRDRCAGYSVAGGCANNRTIGVTGNVVGVAAMVDPVDMSRNILISIKLDSARSTIFARTNRVFRKFAQVTARRAPLAISFVAGLVRDHHREYFEERP